MSPRLLILHAGAFVGLLWGCSSSGSGSSKPVVEGGEGQPCPKSRSCDVNLACIDGKCMKPGDGAAGVSGSSGSGGSGGNAGAVGGADATVGSGGGGGGGWTGGADGSTGGVGGVDAAAGAAGTGGTAGRGGSGGGGSAGSGGMGGADAGPDAPAACSGTHPLLDGGARFCKPDECRCEMSDSCFPRATISACCRGNFQCFGTDGGAQQCQGSHPLIDGGRYCAVGNCYCQPNDTCYTAAIATGCCSATPVCRN